MFSSRVPIFSGTNKIPQNLKSARFMKWEPVLFCLGEILNARRKTCDVKRGLGRCPLQHRQTVSQARLPGGLGRLWRQTQLFFGVFLFVFFLLLLLTLAKLKQEVLNLGGSK